ncbi:MAG: P1 family peptidase [Rhodobacteraceae bacterium]|nr:P1 family peptidase [Paracoccaceae bacterium]
MKPGMRNLITDIRGLRVGNAEDKTLKSGSTVLLGDKPFTAAVSVMGGAPGTRDTDMLAPDKLVAEVDALVLSGGSAFGLDAASGVVDALRAQGRGFVVGEAVIPLVPAAILFDLLNGGEKAWRKNPYHGLGMRAFGALDEDFMLGSVGAGCGATTGTLKGGLGSASVVLDSGHTVGALVAVNAFGAVTHESGHFWAAPWEVSGEFGGLGPAPMGDPLALPSHAKMQGFSEKANTTIAIVATDAVLDKAQATRMATVAHDGMARSILPSHTPVDGDLVFAVATGEIPLDDAVVEPLMIGHAAALCLSRAIARGVYEAQAAAGDTLPTWQQKYG